MKKTEFILAERKKYHDILIEQMLWTINGAPSNADVGNKASIRVAAGILRRLGGGREQDKLKGQNLGNLFEEITLKFIEATFQRLKHLRPGDWAICKGTQLAEYEQYAHLAILQEISKKNPQLPPILGNDYLIKPDIVLFRRPVSDKEINSNGLLVDKCASLTSLRQKNGGKDLLHASISCKWTLRSDRAQNARSEALNLVRNRKGRLPHIVLVTAEPMPSRIASIALGTGDVDCVYHFALDELLATLEEQNESHALDLLNIMVDGKRLRDISDLPLDLVV